MEEKQKKNRTFLLIAIAAFVLALIIGILTYLNATTHLFKRNFGVLERDSLVEVDMAAIPQDTLYITQERLDYKAGMMQLIIPKLDLDTPVEEDTIPSVLLHTPGLYEVSQLPGRGDVNVSIAGHRDMGNQEFYYLNTVEEGDKMYLVYKDEVYEYDFLRSEVVAADAWEVISRQGFSALTLTTCDPVGTRLNRLIVVGELVDIYPYTDGVVFE